LHITVNWELKVFYKKNLCREDFIVMGGLGKLTRWQKGNVIEQLRNLTEEEFGRVTFEATMYVKIYRRQLLEKC